jgi:hypothetical protein
MARPFLELLHADALHDDLIQIDRRHDEVEHRLTGTRFEPLRRALRPLGGRRGGRLRVELHAEIVLLPVEIEAGAPQGPADEQQHAHPHGDE